MTYSFDKDGANKDKDKSVKIEPKSDIFKKDDSMESKYFTENCSMIVNNKVWVGTLQAARNKQAMKKLDVTHFVNLSSDSKFDLVSSSVSL